MSITISPSLQAAIEKQKNPMFKTNTRQQKVDLIPKPNILENSKKTNKKTGKHILIGLGIAAAVAAIAFAATKGKTFFIDLNAKKALKNSEKIKNEADGIFKKAETLKEQVTDLFKNEGKKDGKQIATIIQKEDGTKLMQEIASDGSTLRNSTFVDEVLSLIEEPTENGKNVYEFFDGNLKMYSEGIEELADRSEKTAKILFFEDGKLSQYQKGREDFAEGSAKTAKTLFFEDGKLSEYQKDYEESADGSWKAGKVLTFEDNKLSTYKKDYEESADGSWKAGKVLFFEDGKLSEYQKGREDLADGSWKAGKTIEFEPGKPFKNLLIFIKSFFKKEQ